MHTRRHQKWLRHKTRNSPGYVPPVPQEPALYTGVGLVLGVAKHLINHNHKAWERSVPAALKKPR